MVKMNANNNKVSNENILASYSSSLCTPSTSFMAIEDNCNQTKQSQLKIASNPLPSLYQTVEMTKDTSPRPVILFGPFSHFIASQLNDLFFKQFGLCQKKTQTMITMAQIQKMDKPNDQFIACDEKTSEFISIANLQQIAQTGKHAIIPVTGNSIEQFHQFNINPIVFEIKFKSAKQIKQIWNKKWDQKNVNQKNRITKKVAKEIFNSHKKIQIQFNNINHFIINANNNLFFICCKIKKQTIQEQNRAIWCDSK